MTENAYSDFQADRVLYGPLPWVLQPAIYAVAIYRFGRWTMAAPGLTRPFFHVVYFVAYSIVRLVTGIDLPRSATFGPGLLIHHYGGIIVSPTAVVGANFTMRHGVTLGSKIDGGGTPRIGDHVSVGTGACLLGPIRVGNRSRIGAMSLVLTDVADGSTVGGVPAHRIDGES